MRRGRLPAFVDARYRDAFDGSVFKGSASCPRQVHHPRVGKARKDVAHRPGTVVADRDTERVAASRKRPSRSTVGDIGEIQPEYTSVLRPCG